MKIIETVIIYEDYNYVEGNLELKFSGSRLNQFINGNEFSIENILSTKLYVYKKYISPEIPLGINKNRVFSIQLPHNIPTYINNEKEHLAFNVNFDEIICDDRFVTENGKLKINRLNTVKEQGEIFSTLNVTVYGLKKNKRQEVEKISFYELFHTVSGNGKIEVNPKKEFYSLGEKVSVKAIPNANAQFIRWEEDFSKYDKEEVDFVIEKDLRFEAVFSKLKENYGFVEDIDDKKTKINSLIDCAKKAYKYSYKFNNEDSIETERTGCLGSFFEGLGVFFQVIGYLIYGVFLLGLITLLISALGWHSLWLIAFFVLLWLIPKLFNLINKFAFLGYLFNLLIIGLVVVSCYNLFSVSRSSSNYNPPNPKKTPETIEKRKENLSIDYVHFIEWEDSQKSRYSTHLRVNSDYVTYEGNVKNSFPSLRSEQDYNTLLNRLYTESEESLYFIYKSLDSIKIINNISNKDFPDVVVSMVQSIPYFAILDNSCNPYDYQDDSLRKLLQNNPCQGYVKHGIKTPAEFLKDLKGDCDSRTLFIFTILKHYNYDVAVFGSNHYKHSLLGIHLTDKINGATYKEYNGKQYYLWETTNSGFEIGKISNDLKNTNYWSLNIK